MTKIERYGRTILRVYLPKKEIEREEPLVVELYYGHKILRYALDEAILNITGNIDIVKKEIFKYLGKKGEEIVNLLSKYEYNNFGFNAYRDYVDIAASKDGADSIEIVEEMKAKLEPLGCGVIGFNVVGESTIISLRCK